MTPKERPSYEEYLAMGRVIAAENPEIAKAFLRMFASANQHLTDEELTKLMEAS